MVLRDDPRLSGLVVPKPLGHLHVPQRSQGTHAYCSVRTCLRRTDGFTEGHANEPHEVTTQQPAFLLVCYPGQALSALVALPVEVLSSESVPQARAPSLSNLSATHS